jgi:hypothetical protein
MEEVEQFDDISIEDLAEGLSKSSFWTLPSSSTACFDKSFQRIHLDMSCSRTN